MSIFQITAFILRGTALVSLLGLGVGLGIRLALPTPAVAPTQTSNVALLPNLEVSLSLELTLNTLAPTRPAPWEELTATQSPQAADRVIEGIAASRYDRGTFAIWRENKASVTRDDGANFTTLRCPEEDSIEYVTFSGDGTFFVFCHKSNLLLVQTLQETLTRALPFVGAVVAVAANKSQLVWLGRDPEYKELLAISSDQGKTWKLSQSEEGAVDPGTDGNALYLSESGQLHEITGFEAGCGGGYQSRYGRGLNQKEWSKLSWPLDTPYNFALGDSGWAYGLEWTYVEGKSIQQLMAVTKNQEEVTLVLSQQLSQDLPWSIASNDARTLLQWEAGLYELKGAKAKELPTKVPEGFVLSSVDHDGNAVGLFRGYPARWSPQHGWQLLLSLPE